jgi:mono/diheme cytochrome c family protein
MALLRGLPYRPTGISDADVAAIGAYLRSLKPAPAAATRPGIPASSCSAGTARSARHAPTSPAAWNGTGAYLVNLGHCGECHTPRNLLGAVDTSRELAGNPAGPEGEKIPDITQNRDSGIGRWSGDEIVMFLEYGVLPDGDFAGSSMSDVISDNTARLTRTGWQS